jgi:hypothetical protein
MSQLHYKIQQKPFHAAVKNLEYTQIVSNQHTYKYIHIAFVYKFVVHFALFAAIPSHSRHVAGRCIPKPLYLHLFPSIIQSVILAYPVYMSLSSSVSHAHVVVYPVHQYFLLSSHRFSDF